MKKTEKIWKSKRVSALIEMFLLSLSFVGIKLLLSYFNVEIQFSTILPALISSTIFFLGFVLNGVLADYKEAEKIPDEMSVSIESIFDQCYLIYEKTGKKECLIFIEELNDFVSMLDLWFKKQIHTREIMLKLNSFNDDIIKIESLSQPVYVNRIVSEISNLRRYLLRVFSIRETEFLGSSRIITMISVMFVFVNLVVTKYDTVFLSVLYVFGFSTIFIFIFKLIFDLDNPFDYYSKFRRYRDSVSLQSLYNLKKRIDAEVVIMKKKKVRK